MVGGVTVVCFHDALDGEFAQIVIRLQTPLGAPASVPPAGLRCQVALLHPVYFVPETMQVSQLLKELQRRRMSMAIVVDEHGGVDGLVTIEDLIEEIVGEIHDEYDTGAKPVERLKDGSLIIDASLSIKDLQGEHGLPLPESPEYETLAGFMLTQLQRMPKGGDIIKYQGMKLTVVELEGRRIARIKVEGHEK